MNTRVSVPNRVAVAVIAVVALIVIGLPSSPSTRVTKAAAKEFFHQTNLVSDQSGVALILDPNLVNPWGITFTAGSPFWVANNGTGTSTLYSGDVNGSAFTKSSLVVNIPDGLPTGAVFNTTTDFVVHSGTASGRSQFLFATQVGIISGWNSGVSTATALHPRADWRHGGRSLYRSRVRTGGHRAGTSNYLYAADLEHNHIDVYDKDFHIVTLDGTFSDPNIPNSYSTFNIQNLGGKLYVAYAQQSHKEPDEETDRGSGFVDVFDTSGHLLQRLIMGNHLNAPWGMALAPASFGSFSGALIVGNFGNGHLQAFDPTDGKFLGQLKDEDGGPITIDGLWGIAFGNGTAAGDRNALYFASGPDGETHGLFGSLRLVQQP